jgi:hypothetical protein
MKILPVVESINADIKASSIRIKKASSEGYAIAGRTASIYKQNSAMKCLNITRSVGDKLAKNITIKELPYCGAAIGLLSPLPFGSAIFFILGFLARYSIPKAIALCERVSNLRTDIFTKISQKNNTSL